MELQVQKRNILGKKVAFLRKQGLIPAELYGHGRENIHLSVPAKDFFRLFKEAGESTIIKLKIEDLRFKTEDGKQEEMNVLIHDIQKNFLTGEITHIDFYQVRMDEKITASIPLEFVGESPAVKEKDGILIKAVKEVEVEALPGDLPHNIPVDLGSLSEIGDNIYAKDLKVSVKVKLLVHPETVIATVTQATKEEEVEKPISVEDVKVEGEEKKVKDLAEKSESEGE